MSFLKPGTLCVTVGGSGENAGRIVRVVRYYGPHEVNTAVVEGYLVETVSGRPFASTKEYEPEVHISRYEANDCVADRSNLRPLDKHIDEPALIAGEIAPLVAELLCLLCAEDSEMEAAL